MPSPEIIGLIGLVVMIGALFLGVHIGIVLGGVGLFGCIVIAGFAKGIGLLASTAYYTVSNYGFVALPMFIMMGEFAFQGEIGSLLYTAVSKWMGHRYGGLAMATTVANAMFATIAGDSLSATATFGKIAIPEMIRYKYDKVFACGVVASAGCLAVLIPPSGVMILYCIFTSVSLGKLMIAGFIPGILSTLIYMSYIYTKVRLNPGVAPRSSEIPSWKERFLSVRWIIPLAVVMLVMFGGIYTGIFSPIEAGAIGAFTVLILNLARRTFSLSKYAAAMANVARTTAMIFLVIIGAMIFSKFLVLAGIPDLVLTAITSLHLSKYVVLLIIIVLYLIMGCFMTVPAMLAVSLPLFFPLAEGLGFNGIWFGIIIVLMCEIAALTPPVGLNVYVLKAVVGDLIPTGSIFRGIVPFFILNLVIVAILIAFPQLSLWLPSMMFKR
jgi:tripartite ATP-independent transporter DctM subunit